MENKLLYLIAIASAVLGLATILFFPFGVISAGIAISFFVLALILFFKQKGGNNV
jgi:hypothetical protein